MKEFDMPLFDIKILKGCYVLAGGGGKVDYGIENGVIVIDKESGSESRFKTEDIIRQVEVLDLNESHEFEIQSIDSENKESPALCNKKFRTNIVIAAIGTENFYLLRFQRAEESQQNSFTLVTKIRKAVKKAFLQNCLILLDKAGTLSAYADIFESAELFDKSAAETVNTAPVSRVSLKSKRLVFSDGDEKADSCKFIENFFVKENSLHLVTESGENSSYEIEGEMKEVEGKIEKIFYHKGEIKFYSNHSSRSILGLGKVEKRIPRVTEMVIKDDFVAVSTVYGDIYVYENGKEINRVNVSDIPITGLGIEGQTVQFTVLHGVMSSTSLRRKNGVKQILICAFIFLLIAFGFKFGKNCGVIKKVFFRDWEDQQQ